MKLKSIGAALVRYFGAADTSVPPKIVRKRLPLGLTEDEFVAHMTRFADQNSVDRALAAETYGNPVDLPNPLGAKILDGPHPWNEGNPLPSMVLSDEDTVAIRAHIERITGKKVAAIFARPASALPQLEPELTKGIKPPDPMPWETWQAMMAGERLPGWSPCMVGNRSNHGRARFVYGLARDQIGMYRMPFDCCLQNEDHTESSMGEKVLSALTHLPTGYGMGVFETQADAALATDLMLPVVKDWPALTPDDAHGPNGFMTWLLPIQTAWTFGGLAPADDYHAHDNGSGPLTVWKRTEATANHGRPEKLS